ncbi:hypothetical protein [Actinoplanes awajinensis]|uniref:Uncharacterized protein n=1 Tax=Actinoplanes awajinensis subsp. mycoplanecinus TaxID=135947 RepID=A0A101JR38_9ACTN|nr:hypothetical protein [Actinoplanes awajinensis]KUL30891.1 hypothetical protein ADL15_23325 [Actinoplanes awajinensis subsp. mycoplanecinus]
MTERPSQTWQNAKTAAVAAGVRPGESYAVDIDPAFIAAVDQALAGYEAEVRALTPAATDEQIWATVEHVVTALNQADEGIDTIEREELAEYLDHVLDKAGIDVTALTTRRGIDRAELTDQWRDW